jgi:hypothetical protein
MNRPPTASLWAWFEVGVAALTACAKPSTVSTVAFVRGRHSQPALDDRPTQLVPAFKEICGCE